jgi:hypothetical protein
LAEAFYQRACTAGIDDPICNPATAALGTYDPSTDKQPLLPWLRIRARGNSVGVRPMFSPQGHVLVEVDDAVTQALPWAEMDFQFMLHAAPRTTGCEAAGTRRGMDPCRAAEVTESNLGASSS